MAITTVTYDVLTDSGITYESVGLSDTLDHYTLDEILDYTYCGEYDVLKRNVMVNSPNTRLESPSLLDNLNIPITFTSSDPLHWEAGQGDYTNPDGLFGRILWLKTDGTYADVITKDNADDYKLITSWTATKYYFSIPTLKQGWITSSRAATSWNDNKTYPCLYWTGNDKGSLKFHSKYGQAGDVEFSLSYQPYIIAEARDGSYILYNLNQGENLHTWYGARNVNIYGSPDNFADGNLISFDKTATYSIVYAAREWFGDAGTDKDLRDYPDGNELPFNWTMGRFNELQLSQTVVGDQYLMFCSSGGSQYNAYAGIRYWTYPSVKHDSLLFWANAGVYFIADNTVYKPIISNNIVTDYSADLSTKSDYDNYDGKTKHDSTPNPPKPDANDNEIDVTMSAFTPSSGFVRYIEMTYEKLLTLASSFNAYNSSIWNIGGDLMKNLISLKVFACSGTHSGIIRNIHIAGHEMTDGNNNPIDGNYINDLGVVDLGTIQVGSKFKFDDWRDYAPYTKIECFVPCCGWAQLPPWVMGRTVTGTLYIDLPNGSCKAVIKAGRTPVAEIGGCCAVDMPLSSVATGAKAAGIINSLANGAVAAFNPTPQNLISGSFGIMSAFNANFTETKGTMGDGSNINGCTEFLIKVTRPASTDTGNGTITETYKHTKGLPCARSLKLAKGDGFTQISDANITGTMTAREKQMIIDGFRHGLIL